MTLAPHVIPYEFKEFRTQLFNGTSSDIHQIKRSPRQVSQCLDHMKANKKARTSTNQSEPFVVSH